MRRKKDPQTQPVDRTKYWPVPGVDGEPYPPHVQEALDLVEKETLRRKRAECSHKSRKFITGSGQDRYGSRVRYRRACRDCHLVVDCEHPEEAQHRERVKYQSPGIFLEFLECRCGEMIVKRHTPEKPHTRRTEIYGFPYERDKRVSEVLPIALELDHDPGTKPGAMERAMLRAMELHLQEQISWTRSYKQGAMALSMDTNVVRNMKGEKLFTWTETDTEMY